MTNSEQGAFEKDCNDTIKALNTCQGYYIGLCTDCPRFEYHSGISGFECFQRMIAHAAYLIQCQQKTIRDLSEKIAYWQAKHTNAQLGELIAEDKVRDAEEAYRKLHEINSSMRKGGDGDGEAGSD